MPKILGGMEKSCVMQAIEHLHDISEEELLEEWKQIESFGLPKVDADEFVNVQSLKVEY